MVSSPLIDNEAVVGIDGAKPGTFTGIFYCIQRHNHADEFNKFNIMHGWESDKVTFESFLKDHSHRHFTFRKTNHDGYYAIQRYSGDQESHGYVLDGWGNGQVTLFPYDPNHLHRSWTLKTSDYPGYYAIQRGNTDEGIPNGVLDGWGNGRVSIKEYEPSHNHRVFRFIPRRYKLSAAVSGFVYDGNFEDLLKQYNKPVEFVSKMIIPNESGANLTTEVSYSKVLATEFSFGFNETLGFVSTFKVNAGIPFLASTNADFELQGEFAANQQWKKSEQTTYSMMHKVDVPPHTSIQVNAYLNRVENLVVPFKATVRLRATADRLGADGKERNDQPVSAEVVQHFLECNKFNGTISGTEGDCVLVPVTGKFVGSYGLDSFISAAPYDNKSA